MAGGAAGAQTGPGGVGSNDGTSTLKIWYRTDNGVSATGALVDAVSNSAGIVALDISETGAQRPTLVTGAVNGFDEISFSGSNRLRTGLTLTTTNFVNDEASSFVVCRADNTTQTSCVYTTDTLVGTTRFTCHIPWSGTVYYVIGTCCATTARIQVGGLTGLTGYSYWSYDANPTTVKQLYRNGALLQNRAGTTTYTSHGSQMFNLGGNTGGTNGFVGDVTEVAVYTTRINSAQRIIVENYLAAKYGLTTAANDIYLMDNVGNGNYDYGVAGIGRVDASNQHTDAQGTSVVRINSASSLDDNEFFLWGHDNGAMGTFGSTDCPIAEGLQGRWHRVWRASEQGEVGTFSISFDLSAVTVAAATDLRLLIDTDNDGVFADETTAGGGVVAGATHLGGGVYQWTGIDINDAMRFSVGTINITASPMPIELLWFSANLIGSHVDLSWATASEKDNDFFTIERSTDGITFEPILITDGAGNSVELLRYVETDFSPLTGISYYRLKQTDFDGAFSYSNVVPVEISASGEPGLHIFPNPVMPGESVNVELNGLNGKEVLVVLGDIQGREVYSKVVLSVSDRHLSAIPLDSYLNPGQYLIVASSDNAIYSRQITITR
jgi:hypothetical protein